MSIRSNILFVVFLTVVVPFINIFTSLNKISSSFESLELIRYLNFLSIVFAVYIAVINKLTRLNRSLFSVASVVVLLLAVNWLLTPYASGKWLLNWLAFVFISLVLAQVICNLSASEKTYLESLAMKLLQMAFAFTALLLITGGTGTFGNAVLRRFLGTEIDEIRVFSRDEKKQEDLRIALANPKLKFFIGDVRNYDSLLPAMQGVDYVFHAAALKQVPSCEFFPLEAIRTNDLGAENATFS